MAQEKKDTSMIKETIMDYIEGFYTADAKRMEKALHPDLAKRAMLPGRDGKEQFDQISAEKLIEYTSKKSDESVKNGKLKVDIQIYDIFGDIATAKAETEYFPFIDYVHLLKIKGKWKIVNVLWALKEKY
jgi:hypothetical protein